jgi:hypothetical protein
MSAPASGPLNERSPARTPAPTPGFELPSIWLVQAAAIVAVVAAALARIVAPGLRGNASDIVVFNWDRASAIATYALSVLLMAVAGRGIYELARRPQLPVTSRILAISGVGIVMALVVPSFLKRLPIGPTIVLALAASLVAICAGLNGLRAPHTRAVGAVLGVLGVASLVRLVSWELAVVAGEHASVRLYGWSRSVATAAVMIEGTGQISAAAWLGTRSRFVGQALSSMAVAGAFLITWGAAQGVHAGAAPWQAILHTALADAPGIPPPYALGAMATFLVSASILFALVSVVQRRQAIAVTSALALALIARGAFDAPLRALSVVVAGVWLMLAVTDNRAMWRSLVVERDDRIARDRTGGGKLDAAEAAKVRARAVEAKSDPGASEASDDSDDDSDEDSDEKNPGSDPDEKNPDEKKSPDPKS